MSILLKPWPRQASALASMIVNEQDVDAWCGLYKYKLQASRLTLDVAEALANEIHSKMKPIALVAKTTLHFNFCFIQKCK